MDKIETVLDEALAKLRASKHFGMSATIFWDAFESLGGWTKNYEKRIIDFLGSWRPDRADTLTEMRKRYSSNPDVVWFGDALDVMQDLAQGNLEADLVANGLPADTAAKVAKLFHVTAYGSMRNE